MDGCCLFHERMQARIDDLLHRVETVEELFVTKLERAEAERNDYEVRMVRAASGQDALRAKLRRVAQMLIEAVGIEYPCDAEYAAVKAVERIKQLEDRRQSWLEESREVRENLEDKYLTHTVPWAEGRASAIVECIATVEAMAQHCAEPSAQARAQQRFFLDQVAERLKEIER